MNNHEASSGVSPKVQLVELAVFLFLVLPAMVLSFFSFEREVPFTLFAAAATLQQAGLLFLVLYFLWRNGEPFETIGWSLHNSQREIMIGALLYVPIVFGLGLLQKALHAAGLATPQEVPTFLSPQGPLQYILAGVLLVIVALSEETIFRGYLIRRLMNLTGKPGVAVLAAAAIFSIGHGYQQGGGVVITGILGVVFGAIFLWRGSLVAPMVIHFLQNFSMLFIFRQG